MPDVRFVCVGDGPEEYRQGLQAMVAELGLDGRLQLLPGRPDMDAVYPAFTLLVLSSISEGTPNVIGEAMACGVPVVSTDVGDAALLVGDTGIMVPPARSDLLADACQTMLSEDGAALVRRSTAARQRIVEEYSIPKLVLKTEEALERAVAWRHQNRRYSPFASRQTRA
jgi:glycosyltransferase involved in cell wall biosynthesis